MNELTHFNDSGQAHMVDVGAKEVTERTAIASGKIHLSEMAFQALKEGNSKKGDILGVARIAAIMAVKKTHDLIPLCHPLMITHVDVLFHLDANQHDVHIEVTTKNSGKTGVEMEALTAVSVGLLTIYDMLKAIDKTMVIDGISLLEKIGGRSGHWIR